MITTFHTAGEIAGIVKWSYDCRIPTSRPLRPSSTTTGNSTRESPTVSASSGALNVGPVNSGMITPAARMNTAVIAPSAISMIQNSVEASRSASLRLPCCSSSVKTGTNAADKAALANRLLARFGTWKASVKAEKRPLVPKPSSVSATRVAIVSNENPCQP